MGKTLSYGVILIYVVALFYKVTLFYMLFYGGSAVLWSGIMLGRTGYVVSRSDTILGSGTISEVYTIFRDGSSYASLQNDFLYLEVAECYVLKS